jgi:hypothetical protein
MIGITINFTGSRNSPAAQDLFYPLYERFSERKSKNYQSKSSLSPEQFDIEFEVSLESAFLGLSRRQTGFFPHSRYRQRNPEMNP